VKRVVADLLAVAHSEHGLSCRLERAPMDAAVTDVKRIGRGVLLFGREMRDELLPHRLRYRREVVGKRGQAGAQRALAGGAQFTSDRVVIVQVERPQQRLERQPLDDLLATRRTPHRAGLGR